MNRIMLIAAAALLLPAGAALAQTAAPTGHGAHAGRSPHQSYRTEPTAGRACGTAMHTLPAGKLPTYGTHAVPVACENTQVASAAPAVRGERE